MVSLLDGNDKFNIETSLQRLSDLQKDVIWMLREKTIEEQTILNSVYFGGFFNGLNNYEETLNIYSYFKIYLAPLYGLLSPLIMMIFPPFVP